MTDTSAPPRVAAVMAVRNRWTVTRQALEYLERVRERVTKWDLALVVVDDGSSDGTAEAIASDFPWVKLLRGDGTLYWGGAMRLAQEEALRMAPDYLLWLNDDAVLAEDAIERLLEAAESAGGRAVCTGAFHDPSTGSLTYSGVRRTRSPFLQLAQVEPDAADPVLVDSFNGNLVLFPSDLYSELGGIDPKYTHHYGDFDMGLRITARGEKVLLVPGSVGATARNGSRGSYHDRQLSRRARLKLLFGPKGYPYQEKKHYLRSHAGRIWPVQLHAVYAAQIARILVGK